MTDLQILTGVIITYIILQSHISYFYYIIFCLAIIMNYKYIYEKNEYQINILFKLIIILIIDYYLIKEYNPIYYLCFHFLPFTHLFKGIFILTFTSKFMKKENKEYFLNLQIKRITSTIKGMFIFFILMSIIHFIIYMYNTKYFIHFHSKNTYINPHEKYFIASNLYNNEDILPDWINQMKKLINYLGKDKVYISIYENGDSTDNTPKLLKEFEYYLNNNNIPNKIVLNHYINKFKFPRDGEELLPGEEDTPEKKEKRHLKKIYRVFGERVAFLAIIRQKAIEYLYELKDIDYNNTRILFFNDIIFNYQDVINLISTNKRDYDVACGMDYYYNFYDKIVTIDLNGKMALDYFPYFENKQAADAFINGDNIRVFSCWNGLISAKADIFKNKKVYFRNITKIDSIPISECLLFNYDNYINGYGKVIINPNIIFSYEKWLYYFYKYIAQWLYEPFRYFNGYLSSIFLKRDYRMTDLKTPKIIMNNNLYNYTNFYNFSITNK